MKLSHLGLLGLPAIAALLALAPAPASATGAGTANIVDTAVAAGRFNTLVAALDAAGLATTLQGPGPFTVFAPTDRAFRNLPAGTVEALLLPENAELLTSILLYHVAGAELDSTAVLGSTYVQTLNGQRAAVSLEGGVARVGGAAIRFTDIQCSNGIIHVLDAVMMPETRNIMDVAAFAGSFRVLVQLTKDAGLFNTLSGPGDFTVFAPTDAAFFALGQTVIDSLRDPANLATLQDILLYHVTPGRTYADQVVNLSTIPMLNGDLLDVSVTPGGVFVDGAKIILTDIQAANGVIHVIDAVLLP